ncbi:MAG: hypothetical protein DI586_03220 [Micavibrio aeruginosavorus]|uniref:Response regulatory domain-containing protein n=1 Tax=Micavibrio aeruginosavorus TaxID=349221 RepID=A0A2W5FKV8_9BACT|nr:MAG: hypothetical protein DI586_03220 [Micavibrio aeruginosavorus]
MSEAPLILIADNSTVSREYIANILIPAGYRVMQSVDGGSALKVVREHDVSLAIIDHYMEPYGGLEFAKEVTASDFGLPMLMVTKEETSDLLLELSRHGVHHLLKKPVEPKRLLETIRRLLREKSPGIEDISHGEAIEIAKSTYSHDELMKKTLDLALKNVTTGQGGPFSAIIVDQQGRILGEGSNRSTFRADPIAHAEVMAIRQATEKMDSLSLYNCILYSSSEPTKIGRALIDSVGIARVYYGLSSEEVAGLFPAKEFKNAAYEQFKKDAALEMLAAAKAHQPE